MNVALNFCLSRGDQEVTSKTKWYFLPGKVSHLTPLRCLFWLVALQMFGNCNSKGNPWMESSRWPRVTSVWEGVLTIGTLP